MMLRPAALAAAFVLASVVPAQAESRSPYCSDIKIGVSRDGLGFLPSRSIIVDHAEEPDLAFFGDSPKLYVRNILPERRGLWVVRPNRQGHWTEGRQVYIDDKYAVDGAAPDVVTLEDKRVRLYYHLLDKPDTVLSAISVDGEKFTSEGVALAEAGEGHPSVFRLADGSWLMAYSKDEKTVGFAKSTDGKSFDKLPQTVAGGHSELAGANGGKLRLYHSGDTDIASLTSEDNGVTWKPDPGYRMQDMSPLADPTLLQLPDGGRLMFFRATRDKCKWKK
jgi:hypothetical protein